MMKSLPFIVLEDSTFNEEGLRSLGLPIEFITKSVDEHNVLNDYGAWYYTPSDDHHQHNDWAIKKYDLQPLKSDSWNFPGAGAKYPSVAYYECSDHGADCMTDPSYQEVIRFNSNLVDSIIEMANDPCQQGDDRNIHLYIKGWRIVIQMGRTEKADRDYDEGIANGTIFRCNED
jgi:hypothetical protein